MCEAIGIESAVKNLTQNKCTRSMKIAEVDLDAALSRFLELAEIPGGSGDEAAVASAIVKSLRALGIDEPQIRFDGAESRTRLKGNCGNLIVSLPGNGDGPRTLLSAHMDTVPICLGCKPVVDGNRVRSSEPTGVGADDRSGCATILTAVAERMRLGDENFSPAVIGFFRSRGNWAGRGTAFGCGCDRKD